MGITIQRVDAHLFPSRGRGLHRAHVLPQNQRQQAKEGVEARLHLLPIQSGHEHHAGGSQAWGFRAGLSSQLPSVAALTFFCTSTKGCLSFIAHFQDRRLRSLAEKRPERSQLV